MKNVGLKIKALRSGKKMTQEELGKLTLHKKSTISKWENGKLSPDVDTIKKIAKIFNVTMEELLNNTILEKTVKRKQKNEKMVFEWASVNYDGISNREVTKEKNWIKISLYLFFALVAIAGIILMAICFVEASKSGMNKARIILLLTGLSMISISMIMSGIVFKVFYTKEDKEIIAIKHNVIFKLYETYVKIISKKTKNTKMIKSNDVKKIHFVNTVKLLDKKTIYIVLTSGKVITIYDVDESVYKKINTAL